ncbi:protein kinase [Streptomyces sp. NPDC008265]|uniref:serine/threonine-protein kinase n=1 Tax=Streptomyces sp. NPDC008265 TaxID=3364824 RepID=UPI0036E1A99D
MVTEGENARLIAGRYRLDARLGRGGMGVVWRATDLLLGRNVAVKEVAADPALSEEEARRRRERTLREARAAAQLGHPHIIVVHDVVEDGEHPYIVMELVEGGSLADRLAAAGPVEPAEAARIGLALLGALRTAHAAGVLHRDIKPANVLLEEPGGRVVLTDFGIAQVAGATTLTATGAFVGSPEYTAPERMAARTPVGPESDLWSLGALLCAAVSGASPFRRDSFAGVLHAVVYDEISPPAACGPLLPVVRGLLERDPAVRLDAERAQEMLATYADPGRGNAPTRLDARQPSGNAPAAPPAPTPVPAPAPGPAPAPAPAPVTASEPTRGNPGRRRPVAALVAGLLVAAIAGAGLSAALLTNGEERAGRPADAKGSGPSASVPAGTTTTHPAGTGAPPPGLPVAVGATSAPDLPASVGGAPAGYRTVQDPAGFSLAVPEGFTRRAEGPRIFYLSPGETFRIGIKVTEPESGGPLAVHQRAHARGATNNPGYRNASVAAATHNGRDAALWLFTWDGFSAAEGPRHTRDLCWEEDGRLYDVWVSAPVAQAEEARGYLDTALRTFVRTGG